MHRNFELRTTVYDRSVCQPAHSTSLTIHCYYPTQGRFTSTPIPDRGALIGVCGEIVGRHEQTSNLCLLLQELTFLSSRGTRPQQSTSPEKPDSTTPNTSPSRKRKWSQWGSTLKDKNPGKDLGGSP